MSVATSTTSFGRSCRCTYHSASVSTMRPSASVLMISKVLPDAVRITSPGRDALPEGMFSASAATATAFTGAAATTR